MMRLSAPGFERFTQAHNFDVVYGGSEANVGVSLVHFGIQAVHITCFPDNDLGKAAVQTLRMQGIDTRYIAQGPGRMGLYFLENGAVHRASKIIYDRFDSAFSLMKPEMFDWEEILHDADWFHYTGITPAISATAAEITKQAVLAAKKQGITVSGDINYRRNLWQYGKTARDVMPELVAHTDIVVAGITDFENCLGISGTDFLTGCVNVQKEYKNVKKITQTLRDSMNASHNKLSAEIFDGTRLYRSREYDITHIVDRVGGGDAFMAGIIYGLLSGKTDQETIEFAVAASALKHTIPGDVNLVSVDEVEDLVQGKNVGKLLR